MDRFARIVIGYHGCDTSLAKKLLSGKTSVRRWTRSGNPYDWLGSGIYFWEHDLERAKQWARKVHPRAPAVVGAVIQLGNCLDLTNAQHLRLLARYYRLLRTDCEERGQTLPQNRGEAPERKARELDCAVINYLLQVGKTAFQTVRSPFWEGKEAFPGSAFRRHTHIQIAVRESACILGVFRPS